MSNASADKQITVEKLTAEDVLRAAWIFAQAARITDPDKAVDIMFEAARKVGCDLQLTSGIRGRQGGNIGHVKIGQKSVLDQETTCSVAHVGGGAMECRPCALAWDRDDPAPRPECERATFGVIIDALIDEALLIEGVQRARVAAGDQTIRDRHRLTRARQLRAGADLVALLRDRYCAGKS